LPIDPLAQPVNVEEPPILVLIHVRTIHLHASLPVVGQPLRDGKVRHLVEVRREQRPALVDCDQVVQARVRDGRAVLRRRAPPDLVHDDKRPRRSAAQDLRRLHHLDHEGALVAVQVVGGPDAAEDGVDDTQLGVVGGHVATDLREDSDERVLPQERAFAGHVGPRDEPQSSNGAPAAADEAVVADEGAPLLVESALDGRVPATDDGMGRRVVEEGPGEPLLDSELGEGGGNVELVEDGGVATQLDEVQHDSGAQGVEDALLLGADAMPGVLELLAETRPFRGVKGARRLAGAQGSDVGGDGARVSALDMTEVAEGRAPAERERGCTVFVTEGLRESFLLGVQGGEVSVELSEDRTGLGPHDPGLVVVGVCLSDRGGALLLRGALGEDSSIVLCALGGDNLLGEGHHLSRLALFHLVLVDNTLLVDGFLDSAREPQGALEAQPRRHMRKAVGFIGSFC
ncbi:hypothetical protein CI238_04254, partial [Colletotrichum incanum]